MPGNAHIRHEMRLNCKDHVLINREELIIFRNRGQICIYINIYYYQFSILHLIFLMDTFWTNRLMKLNMLYNMCKVLYFKVIVSQIKGPICYPFSDFFCRWSSWSSLIWFLLPKKREMKEEQPFLMMLSQRKVIWGGKTLLKCRLRSGTRQSRLHEAVLVLWKVWPPPHRSRCCCG